MRWASLRAPTEGSECIVRACVVLLCHGLDVTQVHVTRFGYAAAEQGPRGQVTIRRNLHALAALAACGFAAAAALAAVAVRALWRVVVSGWWLV